ncbi:disulfide bond formation protein B [Azospirillum picis]|uniref:Disulfide bond formation protein DsbB n=1 Tax=Azospirillum picis TaxID=488438 RepID=A0ABU0MP93_9PROT|nr:disulfide bond formation protein B [Azospirillum picis]MBP2301455.1 disulfide bond formation protein DsbB [Azospirillum picis]MDQ0535287.1 disulfide bond formation protein DsbB [Azospirillum picis]
MTTRPFLSRAFEDPRIASLLLALASAGVLLAALFFQFVLDYQPCVLCIMQRWPYVAVMVFALATWLFRRWKGLGDALLVASGLALLAGAGIAAYHVGVEQHWWAGTSSCGGSAAATSLDALRAQVMAAPVTRCDEVAWSLFGISMAGYNVVISLGLAAYAFVSARTAYTRTPVSRTAL